MRIIVVLFGLFFFSCSNGPVEKPKKLLSEDVMVNILYDAALLQAAEGQVPEKLTQNNIRVTTFIYNKYKIDSMVYYQNHKYYASNIRLYKKMYKKVISKLENAEVKLDSLDNNNKINFRDDVIKNTSNDVLE